MVDWGQLEINSELHGENQCLKKALIEAKEGLTGALKLLMEHPVLKGHATHVRYINETLLVIEKVLEKTKRVEGKHTLSCPCCKSRYIVKGNFSERAYFDYYCKECYEMFNLPLVLKKEI